MVLCVKADKLTKAGSVICKPLVADSGVEGNLYLKLLSLNSEQLTCLGK